MSFCEDTPIQVWLICGVVMHFQGFWWWQPTQHHGKGVVSLGGFGWKGVGFSLKWSIHGLRCKDNVHQFSQGKRLGP